MTSIIIQRNVHRRRSLALKSVPKGQTGWL